METSFKLKIGLISAFALGWAGITYYVFKKKHKIPANAIVALDYLTIKSVTYERDCEKVISELLRFCSEHHAIGFDCEWVTHQGKRSPVALVQLSTFNGHCGLFRLCIMKTVPQSLKNLLEDETIYKVGVAPADDAKYLAHDYGVNLKGTLDIRHIAVLCNYEAGGLAALSKSLLGLMLDKSWRVRCSDWEAELLSPKQTRYAAADAHVAIKIFVKLINQYYMQRTPYWKRIRNNNCHWDNVNDLCWEYSDICFRTKTKKKDKCNEDKEQNEKVNKDVTYKRDRRGTRATPLYHNCFLEAPDGELLCTCDSKKAIWYVDKELADLVKEDPLTVRLRFEPAGRSVGVVGRYYQLKKENKCVVCGAKESYIRKNVVPKEYRKHFPEVMKDHSSHDVVLLCVPCHQRSNIIDEKVRARLERVCRAPILGRGSEYNEDVESRKVRSAARALLYQSRKHNLPEDRRKQLENKILQHYLQCNEITKELLEEAANVQVRFSDTDYECHGQKVVDYYQENDGLLKLEEMWRKHFLYSMRPKYMPELWSVNHNEERLRIRLSEGRLSARESKLIGLV